MERSSEELKDYVLNKYIEIHKDKELNKSYMLRKGLFEKFHAELIPLYLYSQICADKNGEVKYQLVTGN